MKKLFLLICCILTCNTFFGQPKAKEYFLERSRNQKTTAWILLGAGTAAIVSGVLVEAPHRGTGNSQSFTGGLITVGGIIGTLTSIPFFISSSKNKKRATTLIVSNQRILHTREDLVVLKAVPTISLRISLNR